MHCTYSPVQLICTRVCGVLLQMSSHTYRTGERERVLTVHRSIAFTSLYKALKASSPWKEHKTRITIMKVVVMLDRPTTILKMAT